MPRAGRDFVTGDDMTRNDNPGGRPRKYANDAEKQKAYRERWGRINVRVEARTEEVVRTMAQAIDATDGDIVNAAIKYYATNFTWQHDLFGKRLPTIQDKRTREAMERERANREFLKSED